MSIIVSYEKESGTILGYYIESKEFPPPKPNVKITDEEHIKFSGDGINHYDEKTKTFSNNTKYSLDDLKEQCIIILNIDASLLITNGFYSKTLGARYKYKSTQNDQLNLNSLVLSNDRQYVKCSKIINGVPEEYLFVEHSSNQLKSLLSDFNKFRNSVLIQKDDLKQKILLCEYEESLDKLNLGTNISETTNNPNYKPSWFK